MNSNHKFYVYLLRRPDKEDPYEPGKGQPFYIGKGSDGRHLDHRNQAIAYIQKKKTQNSYKNNIIVYLWRIGFDYEVQIIKDGLSQNKAFSLEIKLIKKYGKIYDGSGVLANLTDGGDGMSGFKQSVDHIEKRVKQLRGKKLSEEIRKRFSESHIGKYRGEKHPMYGKHQTEETKKKLRELYIGIPRGPMLEETKQKLRETHLGKVISKETRQKMSDIRTGKKLSEEHKRHIGNTHKGKVRSTEARKNISEAVKNWWKERKNAS